MGLPRSGCAEVSWMKECITASTGMEEEVWPKMEEDETKNYEETVAFTARHKETDGQAVKSG